ncbi:MAG: hypothetical protein ACXVCP_18980 [Bdellovibrio sp.]
MKLRFDHSYTTDQNFRFRKKLEKAGFRLKKQMVEHPGKAFCKFIMFPSPDKAGRQYLEFIHFGKGGKNYELPGLSLGALESLEPFSKKLEKKKLKVHFYHKNYEWKKNSKDRLPGWNFISFPKHKSKIYTWLTEYEFSKKRKLIKRDSLHPNKVYKFVGIDAIFNADDLNLFKQLCGKPRQKEFMLSCGTSLSFRLGKTSKICSIILATKDLNTLVKKFKWDDLVTYKGMPGVRIKNFDKKMWDVIIVQGND